MSTSKMYKSLLLLVLVSVAAAVDYTGHMVIQVVPETQEQLDLLVELQNQGHDFWDGPNVLGIPSDIRVSPTSYYQVARSMSTLNLSHKIKITDVGKLIADNEKEIMLRRAVYSGKALDFDNFHTNAEINAFLVELDASSPLLSVSSIGKTEEGRDIWMAKISPDQSSTTRKAMWFSCDMHAREWATPASCIWMVNELVTKYDTDSEIKALVDYADWLIVPISNPDGYEFSWKNSSQGGDRLWRKNRQPNSGSPCIGTDPNRNFDANWSGEGASGLPCSDTYYGPSVFSSQEARAMRDVILAYGRRVVAAVDIHAYSQYWMSPYGYKSALPPTADYNEMYRVMRIATDAVTKAHGKVFTFGSIANVIYVASGSTADWTYDAAGILYSYALELRDTGTYGFIMPPREIAPCREELFAGLKAMAKEIQIKLP